METGSVKSGTDKIAYGGIKLSMVFELMWALITIPGIQVRRKMRDNERTNGRTNEGRHEGKQIKKMYDERPNSEEDEKSHPPYRLRLVEMRTEPFPPARPSELGQVLGKVVSQQTNRPSIFSPLGLDILVLQCRIPGLRAPLLLPIFNLFLPSKSSVFI